MNVGIIGSGGREHAICLSIKKSKKVNKIYCILVMLERLKLQKMSI